MKLPAPIEIHQNLTQWYEATARPLPWRQRWSKHKDPWHIWVSEIMLQQTVIKAVLPVYERFLQQYPSPQALAKAESEAVRIAVRGLGYYRRFDLLHRAARFLVESRNNVWPKNYHEWLEMPGIGDYTASALASITLDQPHGVVDGNVERVLCRLMDIRTAPNLPELKVQFKKIMDQLVQLGKPSVVNQAVMELGQTVCTPTSPKCNICPLTKNCLAFARSSQDLAPAAKARPQFEDVDMVIVIPVAKNDPETIHLARRPSSARFLKSTLGFMTIIRNAEGILEGDGFVASKALLKDVEAQLKAAPMIRHNITKHKIHAKVVRLKMAAADLFEQSSREQYIEALLVSNLDRKALMVNTKINTTPAPKEKPTASYNRVLPLQKHLSQSH